MYIYIYISAVYMVENSMEKLAKVITKMGLVGTGFASRYRLQIGVGILTARWAGVRPLHLLISQFLFTKNKNKTKTKLQKTTKTNKQTNKQNNQNTPKTHTKTQNKTTTRQPNSLS